jgi:hypothetical protein
MTPEDDPGTRVTEIFLGLAINIKIRVPYYSFKLQKPREAGSPLRFDKLLHSDPYPFLL